MVEYNLPRDNDGKLSSYAWPGGYPIYYLVKGGSVCCPECANRAIDQAQEIVIAGVNYEDNDLFCDDCGRRIESAYGED
jgi:hypothetical protein